MKNVIYSVIENNKPKDYDTIYKSYPNSFYLDSDLGVIYKKKGLGKNYYLLTGNENKKLIYTQFYQVPVGLPIILFLPKFLLKIFCKIKFLNTLSCHMQPLFIEKLEEKQLIDSFKTIIYKISDFASKNNLSVQMDFICFENIEIVNKIINNINFLKPCATARIELDKTEEEIFNNFPKSIKNTLNKEYGTTIKKVTYKEYFYNLKKSWSEKKLSVNSMEYYKLLSNIPNSKVNFYLIFSKDNQVLAGSILGFGNKTATEFSMFSTSQSKIEKIPGGDILKWFLIKECIKKNLKYLDLNMIKIEENMDLKSQNINFFKTKWGVKIVYGIKYEVFNKNILFLRYLKNKFIGK